jgi:hypothetical protein
MAREARGKECILTADLLVLCRALPSQDCPKPANTMQATTALNRANATSPWERVVAEKRDELSAAVRAIQRKDPRLSTIFSFSEDSQLSSFEEFEQSLERLCTTYSERPVSRFVTEKVYPNLQTLQSFTDAISAATQSQSTASLCWGCILIVIKVCNIIS